MARSTRDQLRRLESATLDELMATYPGEWREVGEALVAATSAGSAASLEALVSGARAAANQHRARIEQSHGHPDVLAAALPYLARARLARLAAQRTLLAAATGQAEGPVRFGLWSGWLVQRLLFKRGLERRPVSLRAFRLLWPLVTQRRILMPLVQPKGIYCFYSRALVRAMAALIGDRPALEVAAGDGTLTRFLASEGTSITATDDQSWSHAVSYPADVARLGAVAALSRHAPRAVVCSFPPPGNTFERRILATPGVELYVVVTTRHRFAAGDWAAYQAQRDFEWGEDASLSAMVLPPELDPAVLVFRRR